MTASGHTLSHTLKGQCLCGAVRFEIAGAVTDPHACHCPQCRRQSGHYVVAAEAPRDAVTFLEDRGLKWYRSSPNAQRGFCGDCGSVLFWASGESDELSFNLGSLDAPTGLALTSHIFVDKKGDYYDIDDALPKFTSDGEAVEPR